MTGRQRALRTSLITALGRGAFLAGCSGAADKPEKRLARSDVGTAPGSGAQGARGLRPTVDAADLDSVTFALVGLGVGLAEDPKGQMPIVNYLLPRLADYAQILRCRGDAKLGDLGQADIGQPDPQQALRRFITNDYWGLASNNPFCRLISESFSRPGQVSYVDTTGESGSHRYLVRACVSAARIRGASSATSPKECSVWVGVSPELAGYQRSNAALSASKAEDLRVIRDRADALGRRIHLLAERMDVELKACAEREQRDKAVAAQRTTGLTEVLSFGIDLGRELVEVNDPSGSAAQVLGAINPTEVSTALKNLFSSAKDFPTSCTEAERARLEGETLRLELELLIKQHNQLNVEAE